MKPTSIIFLVVSVLLIIGGVIACTVAKDIAVTDGYTLFHDAEGGGTYVRHDFKSSDVNKIELVVTDAEIHIYGGAEESYIEFFNFHIMVNSVAHNKRKYHSAQKRNYFLICCKNTSCPIVDKGHEPSHFIRMDKI